MRETGAKPQKRIKASGWVAEGLFLYQNKEQERGDSSHRQMTFNNG